MVDHPKTEKSKIDPEKSEYMVTGKKQKILPRIVSKIWNKNLFHIFRKPYG